MKLDKTDKIEVAYRYLPQCWNNRYATEAVKALVRYGFQCINLERIVAVVNPANKASIRVVEKVGMKFEKMGIFYGSESIIIQLTRRILYRK